MNIEALNDQVTQGMPVEIKHNYTIVTIINTELYKALRRYHMHVESMREAQMKRTALTCKTIMP